MTDQGPPRPRRPRPVDWAVVEPLAERGQAIAKGWLLTLIERAPLEEAGALPAAALAAEGPALCAAVVRALGSDRELDRLRPDGDRAEAVGRLAALAGAADAAATVAAVDALRAVVWAAALEAVDPRDGEAVGALAERLAAVAAVVAATAVAGSAPPAAADGPPTAGDAADATAPPSTPAGTAPGDAAAGASVTTLPSRPGPDPRAEAAAEMDDGDLWIATLERHVDRCQREGGGLALLRVELEDGDRVVASAAAGQEGVPYGRLAQAIRRAIRRQDLVASDRHGRAWVIAPGVGRAGAIALAERIGAGVEDGEPWRGAPLTATIGYAVYGEDGRDAASLIDRAEEAMLSAASSGHRISGPLPSHGDGPGDRPAGPRLVR